jgi:hypothetical protein
VLLAVIGIWYTKAFDVEAEAGVLPVALQTYIVAVDADEVVLQIAIVDTTVCVAAGDAYREAFDPDGIACPKIR